MHNHFFAEIIWPCGRVRLAQRFPVRIVLQPKEGVTFRMGETAAVIAVPGADSLPPPKFPGIRAVFEQLGLNQ